MIFSKSCFDGGKQGKKAGPKMTPNSAVGRVGQTDDTGACRLN